MKPFAKKKPKRERITPEAPRNEYYENISARLGILQVVLYLSLFAFVVISLLANTQMVTYQNFYYFFRDLRASAETVDIFDARSLTYPTDEEQDFTLYRGGLAVAGNHAVTVFSATGRQLLSTSVQYNDPTVVGAGKYLLVFESGGTQYSLYDSSAQLHTGKSEYPIRAAAVSDSGMYALITAGENSTSSVSLYNSRFQLMNRYNKSGYVTSVAIDKKGERIAILSSVSGGGSFQTSVMIAKPGEGSAISDAVVSDSLGLSCAFTEADELSVLCSRGTVQLSRDGKKLSDQNFDGLIPALFHLSDSGLTVVLKKNEISAKNIVIAFDKNGKIVYNETVSEDITQITRTGRRMFWLTDRGVRCMDLSGIGSFSECRTDERRLLPVSEDEVLLASPQKAVYIVFDIH